jgi:hypothetical protein
VIADPEPQKSIGSFDGKSAIVQRHANRPDFVAVPFSNALELQGRMLRVPL